MKGRSSGSLIFISIITICLSGSYAFGAQPKLKTYGYFDTEIEIMIDNEAGDTWTFDQHHLNLLTIYTLDNQFRVCTEFDWEHGPSQDLSDTNGSFGKIYVGNAFLEYKYNDALQLRAGKFLSPFGIYNVRHDATPTFLFTALPHVIYGNHELSEGIEGRYFARFSTGIQLLGSVFYKDWHLNYNAYLSNGRGPEPTSVDNNVDKGVGFRAVISPPGADLRLGTSYYTDRNGLSYNARQSALGFDLELDVSGFHFESEMILPLVEHLDSLNAPTNSFRKPIAYYSLVAFSMTDRVTPFARYEYTDHDREESGETHDKIIVGINWAITPDVFWKNEYHLHNPSHADDRYHMILGSVAVAF